MPRYGRELALEVWRGTLPPRPSRLRRGGGGRAGRAGMLTDIKSNNPHLTDGEIVSESP